MQNCSREERWFFSILMEDSTITDHCGRICCGRSELQRRFMLLFWQKYHFSLWDVYDVSVDLALLAVAAHLPGNRDLLADLQAMAHLAPLQFATAYYLNSFSPPFPFSYLHRTNSWVDFDQLIWGWLELLLCRACRRSCCMDRLRLTILALII